MGIEGGYIYLLHPLEDFIKSIYINGAYQYRKIRKIGQCNPQKEDRALSLYANTKIKPRRNEWVWEVWSNNPPLTEKLIHRHFHLWNVWFKVPDEKYPKREYFLLTDEEVEKLKKLELPTHILISIQSKTYREEEKYFEDTVFLKSYVMETTDYDYITTLEATAIVRYYLNKVISQTAILKEMKKKGGKIIEKPHNKKEHLVKRSDFVKIFNEFAGENKIKR